MDTSAAQIVSRLLREQPIAALGTLRAGAPFVSMVPFVAQEDFSAFYIHISRLAQHTRDILADSRVSLLVVEPQDGRADLQTLARISIQGLAIELAAGSEATAAARNLYLTRFPEAEGNFSLGDFSLYRIEPADARLVAGFGRIHNLAPVDLVRAATGGE